MPVLLLDVTTCWAESPMVGSIGRYSNAGSRGAGSVVLVDVLVVELVVDGVLVDGVLVDSIDADGVLLVGPLVGLVDAVVGSSDVVTSRVVAPWSPGVDDAHAVVPRMAAAKSAIERCRTVVMPESARLPLDTTNGRPASEPCAVR